MSIPAAAKGVNDFATEAELIAYVQAHPNAALTCWCNGDGCDICGGDGSIPAWTQDPEISGYPHERADRR